MKPEAQMEEKTATNAIPEPATQQEESLDDKIKELLDIEVETDNLSSDEILESIFEGYRIIDEIQDHKIDKYQGLKDYLVTLDRLIDALDKYKGEANVEELRKVLQEAEDSINQLIESNPTEEKIASELDTILIRIEDLTDNLIDKKEEEIPIIDRQPVDFQKLDKLYRSLYQAINENNLKKITLYRGRIIRELKRKRNEINDYYREIKCLDDIQKLLDSNASIDQIKEVLERKENKKFYDTFKDSLTNITKFKNAFDFIYQQLHVRKVSLYKDALKQELKDQKEDLDKRYENEFLEQKGTVGSVIKVFPKAVGLAVQGVANSIDELKEASTGRKKASKFKEVLLSIGKLIATPVIYVGKFLASNWYTLYLIRKGVIATKEKQAQEKAEAEAKAEADRQARIEQDAASREKAITNYMKAHHGVTREQAEQAVDENAKKADYDTQARTYEDEYQRALEQRSETVAEDREKAIQAYQRAYPGTSREKAEQIVDEASKRAGYDLQARSYENVYQGNLERRAEQVAADREQAITNYMKAHQGVTREQAEATVDENAKKADYETQARTYDGEYQRALEQRADTEAYQREQAITNYMKAHHGVTREQAEATVDENAKKADYETQARTYEDQYQTGLKIRGEQEAAWKEKAITNYMKAHHGVTREQAEQTVEENARKADYETQARTYDGEYQRALEQRADTEAYQREQAITSYMKAHHGVTREQAEAVVDDTPAPYDLQTQSYEQEFAANQAARAEQVAADRESAIEAYQRAYGTDRETAETAVDNAAKRAGYDLQARSYDKVYQGHMAQEAEQRAANRERAISGYMTLHPDISREVAEEAVDNAAKVTSYENQAQSYEDEFVDQMENDPNHYELPKNEDELRQMSEEAARQAEELGLDPKETLDESEKPSPEGGRCTYCHEQANAPAEEATPQVTTTTQESPKTDTATTEVAPPMLTPDQLREVIPRPGHSFDREAAMATIIGEFHYTFEEANAICDMIEEVQKNVNTGQAVNPQPETTIRQATPEEIEAMNQQKEEPENKPSWLLLDTNGQSLPLFIPRFIADWMINTGGYVENDGILWSPTSQMLDDAMGTNLTK